MNRNEQIIAACEEVGLIAVIAEDGTYYNDTEFSGRVEVLEDVATSRLSMGSRMKLLQRISDIAGFKVLAHTFMSSPVATFMWAEGDAEPRELQGDERTFKGSVRPTDARRALKARIKAAGSVAA